MKLAWYQLIDNKIRQSIGPYTVSQNIDHLTERGEKSIKAVFRETLELQLTQDILRFRRCIFTGIGELHQ